MFLAVAFVFTRFDKGTFMWEGRRETRLWGRTTIDPFFRTEIFSVKDRTSAQKSILSKQSIQIHLCSHTTLSLEISR
jgi:hypothetical protein